MDAQVRWLIKRDLCEILEIAGHSFDVPWSEDEFVWALREQNCIGIVAEHQERIVGYAIYQLHKHQLHVLNFAVAPWARRQGVGSQMVDKLVYKLSKQRRNEILLEVRETNLVAQVFFRSQGFIASGVLRGYYVDMSEDAYEMRYKLGVAVPMASSIHCG